MSLLLTNTGGIGSAPLVGEYFIRDVFEHPNLTGLTATTKFDDGTEPDLTTDESNPAGAASGLDPHVMSCFLAFSTAVSFDRAKIRPGYAEVFLYVLAYSNDGINWTDFTGSPPLQGTRAGVYGAGDQFTQTTTQTTAKYFRCSIWDEILALSTATKVGMFDFRIYDGATERVVS